MRLFRRRARRPVDPFAQDVAVDPDGWTFSTPSPGGPVPVDVHRYEWQDTHTFVTLPDPLYGAPQVMGIYRIETPRGQRRFAYTEITNGVDLFAVPPPAR